eukprot:CAMPEP_0198283032 /NCGR_PEP_ID=MMETSP1449-20131203/2718_1 /TAXON_ID=420275 /ORGANISM="Attheya septentrionalis, Strain CCMP2084" /LENGTH=481 /DNA_ID=CAMNT_0043979487 /DNA_START=147 /DNA_END=1592 /DNA_ORIENTATION=-
MTTIEQEQSKKETKSSQPQRSKTIEQQSPKGEGGESRNQPQLFMDRLNRLLPICDGEHGHHPTTYCTTDSSKKRLFVEDVAKIEEELLQFDIPRNVTLKWPDGADYISIQAWRWIHHNVQKHTDLCPNCRLHFLNWAQSNNPKSNNCPDRHQWVQDKLPEGQIADVRMVRGCGGPKSIPSREAPYQVLIGGCGESHTGSGGGYVKARKEVDYDAHYHDFGEKSPFQHTYAHLHFTPDERFQDKFGFPELWNVTDAVRLLLRPPPDRRNSTMASALFVHNDCNRGRRGNLISNLVNNEKEHHFSIGRYGKCFHNAERPKSIAEHDGIPCKDMTKDMLFHNDCEATRDGTKTMLSSLHKFTFALENTFSEDYFTEKRWQVLFAGSVPIVFDNHNSRMFLPDDDAAVLVGTAEEPAQLARRLRDLDTDYEEYSKLYLWKERGLRPEFVRKLFLSTDYLMCRICEHVAHHHGPGKDHAKNWTWHP